MLRYIIFLTLSVNYLYSFIYAGDPFYALTVWYFIFDYYRKTGLFEIQYNVGPYPG